MSICFIADLHLSGSQPETIQRFLDFLKQEAPKHQSLYILGDLFELWLGDDISIAEHQRILSALLQASENGLSIFLQQGNRDFLYGTTFEQQSGCQQIPDPYLIKLNHIPTLLTHGDQLCTEDRPYQRYRAIIRHPLTQWIVLHLPPSIRRKMGQGLRQRSGYSKSQKKRSIMDVTPSAVESLMSEWGVQQLIHGHTHQPAIHPFHCNGAPAQRIVLGDWDSTHNVVIYQDGTFIQQSY